MYNYYKYILCLWETELPHIGGRTCCPAFEQIYHHCNKVEYFVRVCQARQAHTTATLRHIVHDFVTYDSEHHKPH